MLLLLLLIRWRRRSRHSLLAVMGRRLVFARYVQNKGLRVPLLALALDDGVNELGYPSITTIGMATWEAIVIDKVWREELGAAQLGDQNALQVAVGNGRTQVAYNVIPFVLKLAKTGIARVGDVQQGREFERRHLSVVNTKVSAYNAGKLSSCNLSWRGCTLELFSLSVKLRYKL